MLLTFRMYRCFMAGSMLLCLLSYNWLFFKVIQKAMDNKELVERRKAKEASVPQRIIHYVQLDPQMKDRHLQQFGVNTVKEQQKISSLEELSPIDTVDEVMDDAAGRAVQEAVNDVVDGAVERAVATGEAMVETQESRLQRLSRSCPYCERGTNSWCKYNLTFYNHMLVDEVHKMIFCSVPKCSSTRYERLLLESINPQLNPSEIITHNRTFYRLHGLKYLDMYSRDEIKSRLNTYYKFLVVRDPYERILSAYLAKFVHRDPEFLDIYGKLANKLRREGRMTKPTPLDSPLSFSDLIDIIITEYNIGNRLDQHWDTYENLCQTCNLRFDYIAKFDTYSSDSQPLIKRMCQDHACQKHMYEENKAKTSSDNVRKYYGQLSPGQLSALRKIYQRDMNGFGYKYQVPN